MAIVGVLPRAGFSFEELGMVFEEGSDLVPCVDEALTALSDAGTLEGLETEFLDDGGTIPTLSE